MALVDCVADSDLGVIGGETGTTVAAAIDAGPTPRSSSLSRWVGTA